MRAGPWTGKTWEPWPESSVELSAWVIESDRSSGMTGCADPQQDDGTIFQPLLSPPPTLAPGFGACFRPGSWYSANSWTCGY